MDLGVVDSVDGLGRVEEVMGEGVGGEMETVKSVGEIRAGQGG